MENQLPPLTEHQIQAGFFREASYKYRNDPTFKPTLFYAVLNGAWIAGTGRRKSGLIEKYRDEGWRSGIADFHYDQPRGPFSKLVIEFKRTSKRNSKKAGVLTGGLEPEQVEYLQAISPYAMIRVCYTEEEALKALDYYMSMGSSLLPGMPGREEGEPISIKAILGIETYWGGENPDPLAQSGFSPQNQKGVTYGNNHSL
jgi:hypothetical protein